MGFVYLTFYKHLIHSNSQEIHMRIAKEKILFHETYVSQGL